MATQLNAQPNHSVIDGIAVLQALATSEKPIGGRELARRLQLEPTRANRLLKTLSYMGIARQTATRKYTAGPGMYVLAAQSLFASGFVRSAIPELEKLRELKMTVALGVLWKDTVSYLYHAPPGMSSLEAIGRIGVYPATKGGIGLALLAEQPPAEIEALFADREVHPEIDLAALREQLAGFRRDGYAYVCVDEKKPQHTIALTVGEPVHSAIGLSGYIEPHSVPQLVERLRASAEIIRNSAQRFARNEVDALVPPPLVDRAAV